MGLKRRESCATAAIQLKGKRRELRTKITQSKFCEICVYVEQHTESFLRLSPTFFFCPRQLAFYGATIDNLSCLTPFLVTNAWVNVLILTVSPRTAIISRQFRSSRWMWVAELIIAS
jgi:hypothetical protein